MTDLTNAEQAWQTWCRASDSMWKDIEILQVMLDRLAEALDRACPEEPMNQDEMGGCVWCRKPLGKHGWGYASAKPSDHEEDCAWLSGRRTLAIIRETLKKGASSWPK